MKKWGEGPPQRFTDTGGHALPGRPYHLQPGAVQSTKPQEIRTPDDIHQENADIRASRIARQTPVQRLMDVQSDYAQQLAGGADDALLADLEHQAAAIREEAGDTLDEIPGLAD